MSKALFVCVVCLCAQSQTEQGTRGVQKWFLMLRKLYIKCIDSKAICSCALFRVCLDDCKTVTHVLCTNVWYVFFTYS